MVSISEIIEYCDVHQFDGTLVYFLDKIGPLDDDAYAKFALEIIENFYQCTNSGQMCMMQLIHHADDHDPARSTKFFNSLVYFDLQKSVREELYDMLGHCGDKTTIPHLKYVFFNEQDDDCRYSALLGLITLLRDNSGRELSEEGRRFFRRFLDEEKQFFSQDFYRRIHHLELV